MTRTRVFVERLLSNWPVRILSVVAAIVLYLFYRIGSLEERFFSVPLSVYVGASFVAVGDVAESVRVSLRGAPDEIFLILEDDIEAYVDLTEHDREGQYRMPVMIRKRGTAQIGDVEITVDPLTVTVTQERKVVRTLDVYPVVSGFPAEGFELAEYDIDPSSVEVEGPRSAVETLTRIRTETIDLSRRAEDFAIRVRVQVPDPLATIVGSDIVEFSGRIRPIVVAKLFDSVPVVVTGVEAGLVAEPTESTGEIRAGGPMLTVNALVSSDFSLIVDCTGITEPGSYELPVAPVLPRGTTEISARPTRVTVVLSSENEEGGE